MNDAFEKPIRTPKEDRLNIDLKSLDDDTLHVDRLALQIDEGTPIEQVHLLFELLKCSKIFITRMGVLIGVISRRSLYFHLHYIKGISNTDRKTPIELQESSMVLSGSPPNTVSSA